MKALLFFLSITCAITNAQLAAEQLNVQNYEHFNIYYSPLDSAIAVGSLPLLSVAYDEISRDLNTAEYDTFYVIIAPNRKAFRNYVGGKLPPWVGAYASPARKLMVLKSPRWNRDGSNFNTELIHELVHMILNKYVDSAEIPRWLDEGLAIFYSRDKRWQTATALSKAAATNSLIPLTDIDRVLKFSSIRAQLAYQQSYSAVHYLLTRYDIDALCLLLDGIKAGKSLSQSFQQAIGCSFSAFEEEWEVFVKDQYKWYWISDSDNLLWMIILILFLLSLVIIRLRNKRTIRGWEEQSDVE